MMTEEQIEARRVSIHAPRVRGDYELNRQIMEEQFQFTPLV